MTSRYHKIAPLCVHGGWQIAEHIETRTLDGWDTEYDVLSPKKYPSPETCSAAIAELQARALARAA